MGKGLVRLVPDDLPPRPDGATRQQSVVSAGWCAWSTVGWLPQMEAAFGAGAEVAR